ncbi:MAG: acyl-ACP--UDP-N-acetylglucosamine O-acyltransferase [Planctomycetota bacterium]
MSIHPSAIIAKGAELGNGVDVGPFAIVEDGVKAGDGCRIRARAHLCPGAVLGRNCDIHMNAVIGHLPQDFSYKGEAIATVLGDGVTVRENATIHGSVGQTPTLVGDNCYLMVGSHVAHDCKLGRGVLLANGALLAGHVSVDDNAIVSGNVVIHQFVRVGRLAMLSGGSRFGMDVPPYVIGDGVNAITALNTVGLRRAAGLTDEERRDIKAAFKILYRSGLALQEALARLRAEFKSPAIAYLLEFFTAPSRRGFCRCRLGGRRGKSTDDGAD